MATKEVELVPIDEVKRFAYHLVEMSKQRLLEKGHVGRVLWLFSTVDKIPNEQPYTHIESLDPDPKPLPEGMAKDEVTAVMAVDLAPGVEGVLSMMAVMFPRLGPAVEHLKQMAPLLGTPKERVSYTILEGLMNVTGMNENAIIGRYMQYMIKKVDAYAYIHQAEQWYVSGSDRDKFAKDLSTEPERKECIGVIWETFDQGETISVPFLREGGKVGEGKVTEFLEPRVNPTNLSKGRLVNLLRQKPRM